MTEIRHSLSLRIVKVLNVLLMALPFAGCWYWYYAERIASPFFRKGNWLVVALYLVLYVIFARTYDAFYISIQRISELVYSQVLAAFVSDAIMFVVIWLMSKRFPNMLPGLLALAVQVMLSFLWSFLAHRWYFAVNPPRPSAVVYDTRKGLERLIGEYGLQAKFDVKKTLSAEECLDDLSVLDHIDTVFLSGVHSHDRNVILKYCVEHRVNVYVIPRIGDVLMSGAKQMHLFHLPMLRVGRYNPPPEYLFVKRAMDLLISAIALVVLSPVMLVTALAIKVTDRGPVFYKQSRLTKDGREFNVLKFRSMRVDAEADGVARLSTGGSDSRITPVGRVIRAVRIDELPQLINILKGDLSLVGPRPERKAIADLYEETMPEFHLRLQAKAGLTGYAQVYGKYNTTPYDKLQMDLMYISRPSILEDLRILFATVKILFLPESTEGVAVGATTAIGVEKESVK